MTGDDRDLYDCFAAVRREEEAHVPAISMRLPASHEQSRRGLSVKFVAVTACLAMTIVAVVWLRFWSRTPSEELNRERGQATASITSWKPATDFLLDTPGRELLQGVPAIGEWHGAVFAPDPVERHRRFRVSKHVLP